MYKMWQVKDAWNRVFYIYNTIMIKPSVERPSRNLHIDAFRTSLPGKWFVFLCTLCMFGGDYCHGHSEKEKKNTLTHLISII